MCQIIAARCRKRNIGAISELYREYLEHCKTQRESSRFVCRVKMHMEKRTEKKIKILRIMMVSTLVIFFY